MVIFHPHAEDRLIERGATREEVIATVETGAEIPALSGRNGFRKDFVYRGMWNGRYYYLKQVDVYAVKENNDWLVITILVKYF